jgi:hypothetical protein
VSEVIVGLMHPDGVGGYVKRTGGELVLCEAYCRSGHSGC